MRRLPAHPSIVRYEGVVREEANGEDGDGGGMSIVLEYVEGGSLLSTLREYGPGEKGFGEVLVRSWVLKILEGLSYLHSHGVSLLSGFSRSLRLLITYC